MLTVDRARPTDLIPIAELDRRAWRRNRHSEFIPDGEHAWRHWIDHAIVHCARLDGAVVGAVIAFPCMSGIYCLHKVFVDEPHRGRGIGSELFRAILADADRLGIDLFLTVDPENESAHRLYRSQGFEERELARGYYRPEEDRYVMVREAVRPGRGRPAG